MTEIADVFKDIRSPSDAHDSAWKRDPGHDRMTLDVLRLVRRIWPAMRLKERFGEEELTGNLSWSGAEAMFGERGERRWFADIALRYDRPAEARRGDSYQRPPHWRILEIKPRIYSVGAVIRQIRVQEENADRLKVRDGQRATSDVLAVVRADDPQAQLLADLLERRILTWDGAMVNNLMPSNG